MYKSTIFSFMFLMLLMLPMVHCTVINPGDEPSQPYEAADNENNAYKCQDFEVQYRNFSASFCKILRVDVTVDDEIRTLLQHHSSVDTAAKYCTYFKIPYERCSCNDVIIRNLHNGVRLGNCQPTMTSTHKTLTVKDIYDLCKYFNISLENCTCDLFNLCDHFNKPKVIRTLYTHDYQIIYAAIATITAFFGILGNLLVLFVSQSRSNRVFSSFNALIKMLAFYDLMFAAFQIIVVFPKFWTPRWLYGEFLCRFFNTAGYLSALLAVGIILAISIERYLKIFYPLYEVTRKRLNMALGLNFILNFSAAIPLFVFSDLNNTFNTCRVGWPRGGKDAEVYNMAIFILFFALPILVVVILYGKIIRHLMLDTVNFQDGRQMLDQRNNDNKRIIQSMVSVVVIFVLFVFPKHIVAIFLDSKGWNGEFISSEVMSIHTFFMLVYIANIPYLFHVCANPLIYSITDSRWRRDLKALVSKVKNTGHHDNITMTTFTTINETITEKKEDDEGLLIVEKTGEKK